MTEHQAESFLDQIEEARRNVAKWPQWMKDSTEVITPPLPAQLDTRTSKKDVPPEDPQLTTW
jgi:hypothetical protein